MKEYFDLTIPQKSIWYTEQFYKDTSIANISGTIFIKEKVDFDLLEKAINIVVKNNDALRLRIKIKDNKPKQYFEQYQEFKINCVKANDKQECDQILNNIVSKHIDVLKEKTAKFTMFEFPDKTGGFSIVGNHMICDAWSSALICSEVIKIYTKLKKNELVEDELISTYIDYIESENEYINSDRYSKDMEYWKDRFKQIPEKIAHIIPNSEEIKLESLAKRKVVRIPKKLTEAINRYCKENRISPYAFFMGIYSMYLSKINGLEDVVIGTPMLNRKSFKEKQIVGMFVNTLPFKVNIQNNTKINELFEEVSKDSMSMLRHQKYSYFELVKYIRENLKDNGELYDVALSYQNAKTTANESEVKYVSQWDFNGHIGETINIHISDIDGEESYKLFYDYQINKLKEEDITNLHERILHMINQVLEAKGNLIVENIEIITERDTKGIIKFNDTFEVLLNNETVIEILERVVKKYPNNIAVKIDSKEITYSELDKMINSLAIDLRNKGIDRNNPVAIILDKSIEMIIAMFAILKAGGCYVPILSEEQQDRINYILEDCNPICVITHKDYDKLVKNRDIINIENEQYLNTEKVKIINKENDIAYIIYTSGTTGSPKGVKVMHRNICSLKKSLENDKILMPTEKDISMSLLKYSFDASGIDVYSSLLFGGKLLLIKKEDELNPNLVVRIMEKEKVTRSFLIPKWLEHIAMEDKRQNTNLSNLRVLGTGGEILRPEAIKHLYNKYKNLKIINLYGPTETTMFTTYKIVDDKSIENNYITIGKPIVGSRAIVLSKTNAILPIGMQGELCIYEDSKSIKNIADGYLNKKEETESKFAKIYNPIINETTKIYKTGDIVKLNSNLELEFFGRKDDVVKINGGYLVALNEIEKRIYNILNGNYEVSAFAVPYNNTKTLVVFIKEVKEHIKFDNINEYINTNLTFYMRPKRIIELNNFPTNNSGKVDKNKLKEMALESLKSDKKIILPSNPTEEIIYNIIKKYTLIEPFSVTDDFMQDLEIDSLAIVSIFTEIEEFGIELQDLYMHTNIKDLAHFIDIEEKTKEDIKETKIKVINNAKKFNMSTILLTGVTGFLGIHILQKLVKQKNVKKVFCIIRQKDLKTADKRFNDIVNYYFKNNREIKELIKEKVIIIEGNIVKKKFGLEKKEYEELQAKITTAINVAANVRHYGKEESIFNANVESVKNILEFCNNNIGLAHISTLSIGGFKTVESENRVFTEDELYIGQKLNSNPYLISKFKAEELVLESSVNCKIFRLGNIMPRRKDGKFQNNYNQNAFMNAIKIILDMKKVPQEFMNYEIELSPVDGCATAIVKLMNNSAKNKIYHIVNDKLITLKDLIEILGEIGYNIDIVNIETFMSELNKFSGIGKNYIKEYFLKNKVNNYDMKNTVNMLKRRDYNWKKISKRYIKNILKIIKNNRW